MARIETDYAPITDRASTFGFTRWTKLCKANGKKPIYGVELAVTPERTAKKVTRSPFTFIATDGLRPLNALVRQATTQFRFEPLIQYDQLANLDPSLVIIPGRTAIMSQLRQLPQGANVRVLAHPSTPKAQLEWARERGIPLVAGQDNSYCAPDDRKAYEVLAGFKASAQTYPQHILSLAEMEVYAGREALAEAQKIADACQTVLEPATLVVPDRPDTLRAMCEVGAERLGCDLSDPVYAERLDRELGLIAEKEFEDYFYIIADLVEYAKKHMFVGPARGSSCGSLVCYLLGITTIDPIPFDLIFERFIDINRSDLPDIDIDFSDQRRHKVFEYLALKYGKDHIARLGTSTLYKPKSAINETAAALKIPKWKVSAFTSSIIERSSGDSRALQQVEDTFQDTDAGRKLIEEHPELALAGRLEGHPRHYSQHAAGVVVTEKPVENYVAVDAKTGAAMCDKKDAEELNLLKIDALGLTQLAIFEDCLEMIGKPRQWLFDYPLDDAAAFDVLNKGNWSGIFQFMGQSLQSIVENLNKVENFEDIVSITALARPGPLNSGGTDEWIARRNGQRPTTYLHPAFEPHLKTSLGVVIYQEQVMQIGREIGGLSWEDVTALRKAMSKSLGKEFFDTFGDRFKEGAAGLGLEKAKLDRLWDDLCAYGAWAFNRSHSVAYAYISYWCCVLKAHFPLQFAAATLSHLKDVDSQLKMLRELDREGIGYVPVDAERSTDKWQVGNGRLIGPLTNVIGIGPKVLMQTMAARQSGMELPKRTRTLLKNPKTPLDELFPVKARLEELFPEGVEEAMNIVTPISPIGDVQLNPNGQERRRVIVGKLSEINPRDMNEVGAVQRRGGKTVSGPSLYLNGVMEDDSDRVMVRINRFKYQDMGVPIINRGKAGKALYAMKGKLSDGFRMFNVDQVKYLGDLN